MKYLNEDRLYQLIDKVEKSPFDGKRFSCKFEDMDVGALHEALMTLQQLVRLGIIGFDDEGFVIKKAGVEECLKTAKKHE